MAAIVAWVRVATCDWSPPFGVVIAIWDFEGCSSPSFHHSHYQRLRPSAVAVDDVGAGAGADVDVVVLAPAEAVGSYASETWHSVHDSCP